MACAINDEVPAAFQQIRKNKSRFMVVKIAIKEDEHEEVVVETVGPRDATFADFKAAMPTDEPRYAAYDLEFTTDDGRKVTKLMFILSSPDNCKVPKDRFKYAQYKDAVQTKMPDCSKGLQINDHGDINEQDWIEMF